VNTSGTTRTLSDALLAHLDAAYNLARWLTRDEHDAQDVVQEAYLRALKYAGRFTGDDCRPWLLAIVRNTCFTWLQRNRPGDVSRLGDEAGELIDDEPSPLVVATRAADAESVRAAVETLPAELREAIVLREFEGLEYKEIAAVAGVPIGTVMSRLSRARARLRTALGAVAGREMP